MRKILVLFISIPVILFVILEIYFSFLYFTSRRIQDKFVIPDAYEGWVTIEFENPECQTLSDNADFRMFEINMGGKFCTSSPRNSGWAEDWYVYKSLPQKNLMQNPVTGANQIWHEYHVNKTDGIKLYHFYVGPKKLEKGKSNPPD